MSTPQPQLDAADVAAALADRLGYGSTPRSTWAVGLGGLTPNEWAHRMNQLRVWVDWLIDRYHLTGTHTRVPPCWYQHPVAVEELTALWVAWQAAYGAKEATSELAAWLDRWLWPTLHRLNGNDLQEFKPCGTRHSETSTANSAQGTDRD